MASEFDEFFRKEWIRRSSAVDQLASDFRRFWEDSTPDERTALKGWFKQLSMLDSSKPRFAARVCLNVEFEEQVGENEFRKVRLPVEAIVKAIEAFEAGDAYCPKTIKELF